jgi:hypothetical protein
MLLNKMSPTQLFDKLRATEVIKKYESLRGYLTGWQPPRLLVFNKMRVPRLFNKVKATTAV